MKKSEVVERIDKWARDFGETSGQFQCSDFLDFYSKTVTYHCFSKENKNFELIYELYKDCGGLSE